ncbi:carbon storage regulator CsrA [Cytobacillus depressus]|uniref:Translational regulator CsrA n=1 Tax=Cytobacillus depressus TaxID=1602942 RepID=A0A6L3V6A8_9BACI|nr:carbon storage regulator CsrA [Cytobacillus depressus]KAB2336789.1 carbon storage regulator CsrA [Cytobacillus depressus]
MLVLTRKKNESVILNENIEITILEIDGEQIKIGIKAPKDVEVLRKEIIVKTEQENINALKGNLDLKKILEENTK